MSHRLFSTIKTNLVRIILGILLALAGTMTMYLARSAGHAILSETAEFFTIAGFLIAAEPILLAFLHKSEIEAERQETIKQLSSGYLQAIEGIIGTRLHGLARVHFPKDSYDFRERLLDFKPQRQLYLIGITHLFLAEHRKEELSSLMTNEPGLSLHVVFPGNDDFIRRRSIEVHSTGQQTFEKIRTAKAKWIQLRSFFPQRIVLHEFSGNFYSEYEYYESGSQKAILYTPVSYCKDTNKSPMLELLEGHNLYQFHFSIIETLLADSNQIA